MLGSGAKGQEHSQLFFSYIYIKYGYHSDEGTGSLKPALTMKTHMR